MRLEVTSAVTTVPQPLSRMPSHECPPSPPVAEGRPPVGPLATAQEENIDSFSALVLQGRSRSGLAMPGRNCPFKACYLLSILSYC